MSQIKQEPERDLIERAMEGVRLEVCPPCMGLGTVGLKTMAAICPACKGRGEVVVSDLDI